MQCFLTLVDDNHKDDCLMEIKAFVYYDSIVNKTYVVLKWCITKTRLYNDDPLKPHFYIVKLGFIGVYIIFLISAQKHRLWVVVRTVSLRRF